MSHVPVLLHESLEVLDPKPGEFFIDGTVGGGGHAREILKRIGPNGKLLAIDWNKISAERFRETTKSFNNVLVRNASYAKLSELLAEHHLPKADGLLLDLGFSSDELEVSGRGFSFMNDEPLIMTYSDEQEPVHQLLRRVNEKDLERIIRTFSEERYAGRIAKAIKEAGRKERIMRTGEIARIIANAVPRGYERGRIHPATRTFQALRIYANRELENIERVLARVPEVIAHGGRVAVISFHSLEDRIVKNHFRTLEREGGGKLLTKKPIQAGDREVKENPRSRSAKLRAIRIL